MRASLVLPSIFPVTSHTDFVGQGSIFVAIKGQTEDGINYCVKAIEKGARTLIIQYDVPLPQDVIELTIRCGVTIKRVENTRKALAELSAEHAGFPAKNVKIIAITGTKGKTTTSFLIEHVLRAAGYKTALISSVKNKIFDTSFAATLTTPQPDYLHQFLKLAVENGVEYVVMEVAAQALSLYRVYGITFDGIIFTNFSHEHLEFYKTLDDYFYAKCSIFTHIAVDAPVIINADNERCAAILSQKNVAFHCIGYSLSDCNDHSIVRAIHEHFVDRIVISARICEKMERIECASLFGRYNAYNVLAAVTLLNKLGISTKIMQEALSVFPGVPGRLEYYNTSNCVRFFIDYAHNPDSFDAVLSTLRPLTNMLIVIFGAGGGRDKNKRPLMGYIASQYADIVIITSDNPRLEDPSDIADNIIAGVAREKKNSIVRELDRKKAIEYAYKLSCPGAIVAILGKGPDEYQLIGTKKYFFSEKEIIRKLSLVP